MTFRSAALGLAAALLLSAPVASANTVSIIGGQTRVKITALDLFADIGLDVSLVGSATISGSVVTFPVTGGEVDPATGFAIIEHQGSGVGFTDGIAKLTLTDFLIDTENALISGNARLDGTDVGLVPIFDVSSSLRLFLTSEATDALNQTFGLNLKDGLEFGAASISIKTVPVPAALWFMLTGLGALYRVRKSI